MKKINRPRINKREVVMPEPPLPVSSRVWNWRQGTILKQLFPEGVDEVKIWRALVPILKQEQKDKSGDLLEVIASCKFGLKERIKKQYPSVEEQWYVISQGDTDMLCRVTQRLWTFAHSHVQHAQNAIVLHCPVSDDRSQLGSASNEFLLDWAAQAVVTMLLLRIRVSV